MKKWSFFFLSACIFLTGCSGALESKPVVASAPAFSASGSETVPEQLEHQAKLENASRTDQGVYYQPSRFFQEDLASRLPEGALTMGQAAQQASGYAAAMGLPTTDLLWSLYLSAGYETLTDAYWVCEASLPPYVSYAINYQGTLEEMQPGEQEWSVSLYLSAPDGRLLSYYCSPIDPFELEEHTGEEHRAHQQQADAWDGGEEYRQAVLEGMNALEVGPVKRLLPPDQNCVAWRAELENGDTYFVGAFYGKKELYLLQYSTYYVNGDQIALPAAGS